MSAKFTLEGSSTGAVQAIQQAADALDKTGKAAEGAAKSTRQLTNEAQRIKESLDPQEKLNRKYQELQQHVEAGRISISQATAAGIKYRQELYAASEEGKKAAAAAVAAGEAAKRRAESERKSLQVQLDAGQRLLRQEKELAAAAAQAAREQDQLADAARKIREAISPQEKLNRLTQELATHVKAGRLSIDEATTAHRKYRQELGLAAAAGEELDNANQKAFGAAALTSLTSYLTGVVSVGTALSIIRGELNALDERAEKRAQLGMTTAEAEAGLRKVVATDPNRDAMMAGAERIAEQSRLPLAQIYQAATAGYGSSSSVPISLAALEEATRQSRDPEAIKAITSGIGFVLGSSDITDSREAAGFLNQVLAASPIKDEKVPRELARVNSAYNSPIAGGSTASAGATLGVLSQGSGDEEGERTRTGAIELIKQTEAYFKKNRRKLGLSETEVDEFDERMQFLMDENNIAVAKDFVKNTSFGSPVIGGMATMFLSQKGREDWRTNFREMQDVAARNRAADDTASFLTGGKLQSGKKANEIIASGSDMFELGKENVLTRESYDKLIGMIADQWGGPAPNMRARAYYGATTGIGGVDTLEAIHMLQSNRPTGDGEAAQKFDAMIGELRQLREQQKSKIATRPE